MLQLGFVSAILAEKPFEEVVTFASENHFSCVEMMCWPKGKAERRYAGVTHIDVGTLDDVALKQIKAVLDAKNIFISGLGYYPNPLDPDKEKAEYYRGHIKKVIAAAAKLDIPVVNTFVGRDPAKNLEENFKEFAVHFPALVKNAEENNVKLAIENCPMFFTKDEWPGGKNLAISPVIWRKMFETIPSPAFGLNYDPSHLVWMQMDYIKPIYEFKERLHHIHLKDVKVYKDKLDELGILATPLEYHAPKIPGLGDVNWGNFFAALTDVGYKGPVCIEVEDRAYEGSEANIKSAILTARNYLSQYLVL
ncbi:MAG: sugar phosphate isomerase/epimerase [Bacteroidota bacterium]